MLLPWTVTLAFCVTDYFFPPPWLLESVDISTKFPVVPRQLFTFILPPVTTCGRPRNTSCQFFIPPGPRELQQYSSNQFNGSLRNSGGSGGGVRESNLCPLDAQIHYVSIFISPHYHELGGMEELACCYSARSQTGRGSRLQTTLSQIPKSYASEMGEKTERLRQDVLSSRTTTYNLTCFISICCSLYLIGRTLSFAHKSKTVPLCLNWSVFVTSPCMEWVMGWFTNKTKYDLRNLWAFILKRSPSLVVSSLWERTGKNMSLWLGRKEEIKQWEYLRFLVFKAFSGERDVIQMHGIAIQGQGVWEVE